MGSDLILVMVVVTGVAFDFTNGFHDTANAVATSIATGALKPRVAVGMSAILNLVGAFLSISVAATIAKGIINPALIKGNTGLLIVLAALIGAILWNLCGVLCVGAVALGIFAIIHKPKSSPSSKGKAKVALVMSI
jgi:phosphate/sulfate permease